MRKMAFALLLVSLTAGISLQAQKIKATITSHSATLSWTAATVPSGAPPVTGYNVYRGVTSGGETILSSAGLGVTYTDSTVVAGTTYFYQVTAVNSAGESTKSNEISVLVPNPAPPNAPTGLTGTAQ